MPALAAASAGLNPDRLRHWEALGRDDPKSRFAAFPEELERAKAHAVISIVRDIKLIADGKKAGDWRALAWLLGHFDRKHYHLGLRVELETHFKLLLQGAVKVLPPDAYEKLLQVVAGEEVDPFRKPTLERH